ncbi:MAG: TonB-dependent receptor, partial [Acidobacteriia bacterium]|nr:TonB-dependent receptor [Terriglobia bacterium]
MMKRRIRVVLVFVGLIALAVILTGFYQPLRAQVGTASLSGMVTDPSGAAVPNAEITLESMTRKASRETVTDAAGSYVFTSLLPDTYQLVVASKGFTTKTIQNIPLISGQGSTLNVTVQVGAAVTHVTVTEIAPLLQTTTATLGSQVGTEQLTSIPLLGRSFTDMMLVLPGASIPGTSYWQNWTPHSGGASSGGDVAFYGQRPRNNVFYMDGVLNAELLFNGIPHYPPPEAIAEMKVESGMDSGAYGVASGANISLVTKSGTNQFHADAWEFLRNDKFNARSFLSPSVGRLRWNQFGASGGGPLGKAWYVYGWYEGIRIPSRSPGYALVPSDAELAGDFSADPAIYNPYTSVVAADGTLISRSPFANNQIPTGSTDVCSPQPTCINDGALQILTTLYPRANLPTGSGPGGTNYLGTSIGRQTYDQWSARVDHQFGDKDTFYARYSDSRYPTSNIFFPSQPSVSYTRATNIVVSDTHTFSPTFLLTARYGWQHFNSNNSTSGPDVATPAGTFNAFPLEFNGLKRIPSLVIGGLGGLSQGFAYYGPQDTRFWTADFQKTSGRHTFAFGGWYGRDHFKTDNQTGTEMDFLTPPTAGLTPGTGYGLASLLLGLPSTGGRVIGSTEGDMITNYYAGYVQDSFRATPKLTINLGIRYDFYPPSKNQHGSGTFSWELGKYVYDLPNPSTHAPGNLRRGLIDPDYNNFQPRIGLAYQISPKTTVRASFAIFNDVIGENPQAQQGNRGNWPYSFPQSVAGLNTGLPTAYLQNPFPGEAAGSDTPLGCQQCVDVAHESTRTPYVQMWSLSLQREVTPTTVLQASYFGSHGVHQSSQIVDNTALVPGTDAYQNRQKYPDFPPYVNNGFNMFPSWYDGLSLEMRKTTSHHISYLIAYTWSKSLDIMDSLIVGSTYPFAQPTRFTISDFKGPASFDVTHRLTATYAWEIPAKTGNKLADAVVANWSFSGVATIDSGSPYYVLLES